MKTGVNAAQCSADGAEERNRLSAGRRRHRERGTAVKLLLAGTALALLLAGCSSSSQEKADMMQVNDAAMPTADSKASASAGSAPMEASSTAANTAAPGQTAGMTGTGAAQAGAEDPFSRKIIYRANLSMQVESYKETEELVQEAVRSAGGYVLQFSENASAAEKFGTFVIKVPAAGFESLISRFEKINPAMRKSMEGQDVTEEYVDLSSRLKAKELMESRLLAFMEKATKTEELVSFSTELGKVQEEIERIKGRMRYLEQNVSYSTIELRIVQKIASADVIGAQDRGPLGKRAAQALDGSLAVMGVVLQGVIVIAAGALPVLVLLAVVGLPIIWYRRKRKAKMALLRQQRLEDNRREAAGTAPEVRQPRQEAGSAADGPQSGEEPKQT
ncbi:protein of unknown function [Paenibacillus sp. UNCCL117]|uniref:DUF4349 domain-containing protein n=1 Tax=unclassified Paenibacillus TaxID=185978 RepID=UPI000882924B|nr:MULTISPECIES: DUF4349 domain-containing protein [unclassified Paenibacillus]SDC73842.1 protein of unknown function [Paenibacillus sp. cl123]SFW25100.1 protein of unknown function [Paenibacillus sp. UNCCL117]